MVNVKGILSANMDGQKAFDRFLSDLQSSLVYTSGKPSFPHCMEDKRFTLHVIS